MFCFMIVCLVLDTLYLKPPKVVFDFEFADNEKLLYKKKVVIEFLDNY